MGKRSSHKNKNNRQLKEEAALQRKQQEGLSLSLKVDAAFKRPITSIEEIMLDMKGFLFLNHINDNHENSHVVLAERVEAGRSLGVNTKKVMVSEDQGIVRTYRPNDYIAAFDRLVTEDVTCEEQITLNVEQVDMEVRRVFEEGGQDFLYSLIEEAALASDNAFIPVFEHEDGHDQPYFSGIMTGKQYLYMLDVLVSEGKITLNAV